MPFSGRRPPMPNVLDVLLVVTFAVVLPMWSHFVQWPRHARAVEAGDRTARSRIYVRWIVEQWALALAALALMVANGRPLSALWLVAPTGWRVVGFALPLVYVAL